MSVVNGDYRRALMESSGWLAAHRRSQDSLRRNPVRSQTNSIAGKASANDRLQATPRDWHKWSLSCIKRLAMPRSESCE